LHSSVLERTESDLSKINWLRGVILLNPIVLVPLICFNQLEWLLAVKKKG
jgi:hypothetical protein